MKIITRIFRSLKSKRHFFDPQQKAIFDAHIASSGRARYVNMQWR